MIGARRLRIWLITVGEPLPLPGSKDRPIRSGRLAAYAQEHGSDVTWWSSTFDHVRKAHRFDGPRDIVLDGGVRLNLLHAPPYGSNVSLKRIRHQRATAAAFRARAPREVVPDVILCSFPTIELASAAIEYGRSVARPVILDVRDLWPDIFASALPRPLRPLAAPFIRAYDLQARTAMSHAAGIVAVSDGYLAWGLAKAGRAGDPGRDRVLPIGFERPVVPDADLARARERLEVLGVRFDRILAVFVGTFGRTYDLDTVLRAARILERETPQIQFVLAGDGERAGEWRGMARGLGNVVMPGWLDRDQIAALCGSGTIGLQAYADGAPQGLANKLFEYLGYGMALVSSLQGENARLIDEHACGSNYLPGDAEGLARTLRDLVASPSRIGEVRRNSLALFERDYALPAIHAQFLEHLERVASRR